MDSNIPKIPQSRSGSIDATSFAAMKVGGRRFSCPSGCFVDSTITIKRAPLTQGAFDELHLKSVADDRKSVADKIISRCHCSRQQVFKFLSGYLPIISVLRYYNVKEYLMNDILSGLTVFILHIPQALAFGLLTSVKIENGLYTSVWPTVLYIFFGTSAHVSMGTSAVISIVAASVVDRQADVFKTKNLHLMSNRSGNGTLSWEDIPEFMDFKESISMGVTFFSGLMLMAMGFLKLGFITAYLSDSFFSAFTSGAGIHIATSQIPAFLGLNVPRYGGVYKIVKTFGSIFATITSVNVAALVTALLSSISILFVKDYVNEKLKGKLPIPIPIELFVVIGTTLVSYFVGLQERYGVDIVKNIPSAIPSPVIPSFTGVDDYIVDCFVLAILIFATSIAMAKICAKRHNYELDDSQELIAYGICNFGSSFFRCFPSAVAPPRTMVASAMNTKTTINGVFSAAFLFLLILVMSSLFEPLPKAALAAIIVVSLKGLIIQLKDCVRYWKVNKIDFVIWFFTIVSTVFIDIDYGLGIGVVVSLLTVVFQSQFARGYKLGRTMKDPVLVEHKKYSDSKESSGVKIYRFHSNLFFANAEIFRMALYRATVNPRKILKFIKKQERKKTKEEKTLTHNESFTLKPDGNTSINVPGITVNDTIEERMNDVAGELSGNLTTHDISTISANGYNFPSQESVASNGTVIGIDNPAFSNKEDSSTNLSPFYLPSEYNLFGRKISSATITTLTSCGSFDEMIDPDDGQEVVTEEKIRRMRRIHHVIIDFSTVNYIDISGASVICHIFKEYAHVGIKVFLTNVSYDVRKTMHQADVFDTIPEDNIFVDILDAVTVAKLEMILPVTDEDLEDFSIEEAAEDKYVTNIG